MQGYEKLAILDQYFALSDLSLRFQGHDIFQHEISSNNSKMARTYANVFYFSVRKQEYVASFQNCLSQQLH